MHKKYFQNLTKENWELAYLSKNVFSLFLKLGNSYFCIIMEIKREESKMIQKKEKG